MIYLFFSSPFFILHFFCILFIYSFFFRFLLARFESWHEKSDAWWEGFLFVASLEIQMARARARISYLRILLLNYAELRKRAEGITMILGARQLNLIRRASGYKLEPDLDPATYPFLPSFDPSETEVSRDFRSFRDPFLLQPICKFDGSI